MIRPNKEHNTRSLFVFLINNGIRLTDKKFFMKPCLFDTFHKDSLTMLFLRLKITVINVNNYMIIIDNKILNVDFYDNII